MSHSPHNVPVTRPAAILFDIGDTLLREVRFDLEAGIRAALPAHLRDSATRLAQSFRGELQGVHAVHRELMLSRWLCAHVAELRAADEDRVEDTIWAEVVTLTPTPGARELLERLHADGVKTGAISNAYFSGRVLRREVERHGLADSFKIVISSADLGVRKPDVRIFAEALERLDVTVARTWYVGDTFEEDIEGALRAGLVPVWLRPDQANREVAPPVRHASDWSDVARMYAVTPIEA